MLYFATNGTDAPGPRQAVVFFVRIELGRAVRDQQTKGKKMTPAVAIGVISQVLALCGLVSIRMFLPVFLYFLTMRLALVWPDHAPEP